MCVIDSALFDVFRADGIIETLARAITSFGSVGALLLMAIVVTVVMWQPRERRTVPVVMTCAPLLSLWACAVVTSFAKDIWDRPRPTLEALRETGSASFPSGHASNTTALVVACALVAPSFFPKMRLSRSLLMAAVISAVMGWTRLALGVHWTSDVIAGWVLGAGVAVIVVRVAQLMPRR